MFSGLFDAHCHLQDEGLADKLDGIFARAQEAGVSRVICCGVEEADWQRVLLLKEKYPDIIIPSFGLHPWYLKNRSNKWLTDLESFIHAVPSGVGEFGLDFALADYDIEEQKEVFLAHLDLANKYKRPVSLHCRKAWDVLLELLERNGPLVYGGIIHSFSGSPEIVARVEKFNLGISFSGSITRSGNKKGKKALVAVSSDHLVIETDSPDIVPVGVEGFNEPANLHLVIQAVAAELGKTEQEIAGITGKNAARIFGALL